MEDSNEKDIVFSAYAKEELKVMLDITQEAITKSLKLYKNKSIKTSIEIDALRELSKTKREEFKSIHIERLKNGTCSVESGIAFLDILNVCDSIINHCFYISKIVSSYLVDNKEFYREIQIDNKVKTYQKKYRNA